MYTLKTCATCTAVFKEQGNHLPHIVSKLFESVGLRVRAGPTRDRADEETCHGVLFNNNRK